MNLAEIGNSLGPWLQLLSILGAVVQCVGTIVLWMLVKKFVTREDCEKCREDCQKSVDKRLAKQESSSGELQGRVQQAAQRDEVSAVEKAFSDLRADIEALAATVRAQGEASRGLTRQVNLLIEHHLGRKP